MDNNISHTKKSILKLLMVYILMVVVYQKGFGQQHPLEGEKLYVPQIPPNNEQIPTIITTDAANEIDDVWAISLAILSPERLNIKGFVAGHFDHKIGEYGPKSIEMSYEVIKTILKKAGMIDEYPVFRGSHPMRYPRNYSSSEGVNFIIEKAMEATPENPLWVIALGAATDVASAYLKEPAIKDRIVVFWHGRTQFWPDKLRNFNVFGDIHAARLLFHAPFPLVLFDTGKHLSSPLEESEKYVKPYGKLGEYLYNYRLKKDSWQRSDRGFYDLGDIAVLIDPEIGEWEETVCPTVTKYMEYNFSHTNGEILRCFDADREQTYQLLYDRLKKYYGK